MDPIKEAFQKIKEDIESLKKDILNMQKDLFLLKNSTDKEENTPKIKSLSDNPAQFPTHPQEMKGLYLMKKSFSTGNEGVPTDTSTNKPTLQQTNQQRQESYLNSQNNFDEIQRTLESLDVLRKEIRLKFKRLTNQEMLIFSTIYSLENQNTEEITYKIIASNLGLSESSIRDYVNRLISKGIPIQKFKKDNKTVCLKVSENLKKTANLPTIIKLREL